MKVRWITASFGGGLQLSARGPNLPPREGHRVDWALGLRSSLSAPNSFRSISCIITSNNPYLYNTLIDLCL
ncbi:hypothetical protein PGTUg99_000614 [Puccinia graminis f. sp. tritici]|uniref:Uncharacterized protein n=1 Tax=Puccinia graminis f. sp. tritici TaxID=56615 RepID=A0A5B0PSG4_PUCGR|nr:hypothetical protein PGTUg99_000614 [Puccinia graminis f. sp. tritici]